MVVMSETYVIGSQCREREGPGIALCAFVQATHVWKDHAGGSSSSERLAELPAADADRPRFWLTMRFKATRLFRLGPYAGSLSSGVMQR